MGTRIWFCMVILHHSERSVYYSLRQEESETIKYKSIRKKDEKVLIFLLFFFGTIFPMFVLFLFCVVDVDNEGQ